MRFNFNNNYKQRRLRSNNFSSFGKSSCRVTVTPRTPGSLHIPFLNVQGSFSSSSTKANEGLTKIHFRRFSSRKCCWLFKQKLKVIPLIVFLAQEIIIKKWVVNNINNNIIVNLKKLNIYKNIKNTINCIASKLWNFNNNIVDKFWGILIKKIWISLRQVFIN